MHLVDAAAVALADMVNGLIELRLCRQFSEALLHAILVVQRLRQPELVDAEFEYPLEIPVCRARELKVRNSCAVSRLRRR